MWRNVRAFLRLDTSQRLLLLEACLALALARLAMALLPFRRIAAALGESGAETPYTLSEADDHHAAGIAWAVEKVALRVPWDSRCLAQTLAAWWLLKRRGIAATVYFGIDRTPARPFDTHAWLRCGPRLVTPAGPEGKYQVIATFAR